MALYDSPWDILILIGIMLFFLIIIGIVFRYIIIKREMTGIDKPYLTKHDTPQELNEVESK